MRPRPLDMVIERSPRGDVRTAGLRAAIAGGVCGVVLVVGGFSGPGGLVATVLAAGACVVPAILLLTPENN